MSGRMVAMSALFLTAQVAWGLTGGEPIYDSQLDLWKLPREMSPPTQRTEAPSMTGTSQPWVFGDVYRVNDNTSGDMYLWPDLAVEGADIVNAIWFDNRSGSYRIHFSRSTDGGTTWSSNERVDDATAGMCRFPSIAVDDAGNIFASWEDDRSGDFNVYFSRRIWEGSGWIWTPSVQINDAGSSPGPGDYMDSSVDATGDGLVSIAWTDWREGVFHQVYSSYSTDHGESWSTDVRVSDEIGYQPVAGNPCLLADRYGDPGTLYCVWNDWRGFAPGGRYPEVYFSRSTDGGASWSINVRVNDITDYYQQVASKVLGADRFGNIYVGWYNDDFVGASEFRVSTSVDGGTSFRASVRINDGQGAVGTYPSLAVDEDGDAFAVWMDSRNAGRWDDYFSTSRDIGQTWTSPSVRVVGDSQWQFQYNPVIATDGENQVYIVIQNTQAAYRYDIYATKGAPTVDIVLIPESEPVIIPREGGSFGFTANVTNRGDETVTFTGWTEAILPGGSIIGPILGPVALTLSPGQSISHEFSQYVPRRVPAGEYSYYGCTGFDYPEPSVDRDGFGVVKLSR